MFHVKHRNGFLCVSRETSGLCCNVSGGGIVFTDQVCAVVLVEGTQQNTGHNTDDHSQCRNYNCQPTDHTLQRNNGFCRGGCFVPGFSVAGLTSMRQIHRCAGLYGRSVHNSLTMLAKYVGVLGLFATFQASHIATPPHNNSIYYTTIYFFRKGEIQSFNPKK